MSLKKIRIALLVLIVCVFSTLLNAEITEDSARNLVLNQILSDDIGNVDVFALNTLKSNQDNIAILDRQLSCPYTQNWVFFVDDLVFANWSHPCRYIFINEESGEYQIVNETFPPLNMNNFEKISEVNFTGQNQLATNPEATIENSREANDHLYAVIINGGSDPYYNKLRYWNDMSAIYCTLTQVYGYKPENIYVHSTDGTAANNHGSLDLDNDNIPDIDAPTYTQDIGWTFQTLGNEMGAEDQLLVYVTGVGDCEGIVCGIPIIGQD